ncbi:transposase [Pseudomonadota bacterium]
MPRKPRFYVAGLPAHIVQRGNNRQAIFFDNADYSAYLNWLKEAAEKYRCQLHAYVLMTNHVHMLATSEKPDGISRMIQFVGRHYVPYINHAYGRTGTLWEGRYKSSLIDEENYLLICMRYIELNPVRAGMVNHPGEYRWSSYHANAEGVSDSLLTPHNQYLALGHSGAEQTDCYRELFKAHVEEKVMSGIRAAWQTGTPLGNDRFREEIEKVLNQKIGHNHRGRPKHDTEKGL